MNEAHQRWLALLTTYLLFISTGLLFFLMPPMLTELRVEVPMDDFAFGCLQGSYTLPAVFLAFIGGALLDRWDTRRTGIFSALLMLAGSLVFNIGENYYLMLLGRFASGVGAILINLVAAKMLSIWFREKQLGLAMSVLHTAWPITAVIAYSTFFAAAQVWGWKLTAVFNNVFVAFSALAFILWAPREPESHRPVERPWSAGDLLLLPRDIWLAAGAWFCFTASMASVLTFGGEFFSFKGLSYGSASFITGLLMWTAIPGSLIAGWLLDRYGSVKTYIVVASLGAGLCLLTLQSPADPVPLMLLGGLLASALPVAVYSLPGLLVQPMRLGVAFGIILTFSNLGNTVGPVLVGWINTVRGEPITGMVVAALIFTLAALIVSSMRKHRLAPELNAR